MKKTTKFILTAFVLTMLTTILCITAYAANGITEFAVNTENAADASALGAVKWFKSSVDEKYYIFLPNGNDGSGMTVWFTSDDTVKCGDAELISGQSTDVFAGGGDFVLTSGGNSYNVRVLQSEGIGTIYINTESGSLSKVHANKEYKEPGTILIIGEDGEVQYNNTLEYIKGRGNSTWTLSKKPYNIKLDKKTNLFGMGKSKKWCLLANAADQSLLRNTITYDFAQNIGVDTTSDTIQVNVYINGEYKGVYIITEKVDIDDNRIEIYDLEGATEDVNSKALDEYGLAGAQNSQAWGTIKYANIPNNPKDITGGYLLELEKIYRYVNEPSGFITKIGQAVVVKTPEFASKAQVEYISKYYQDFENALYSATGYNSLGKHYSEYIDVESLAKMYIVEEFGANFDGCSSSFYLYKDIGGKLTAGPAWDFDTSLGVNRVNDLINHVQNTGDPSLLYVQTSFIGNHQEAKKGLLAQAFSHEDFRAEVQKIWNEKAKPYMDTIDDSISFFSEQVRASVKMNAVRWNVFKTTDMNSIDSSYTNAVNVIKKYLNARYPFLSEAYAPDTYFVMYDTGEYGKALVNDTTLYKSGDKAKVLAEPKSKDNTMLFDGWSTNPDGTGEKYNAGDVITVSGNIKLYAQWKPDMSISGIIKRMMQKMLEILFKILAFFNV